MGNVTAKTSGDIASFMTPAETNIKSLKVHFSPKQLGEGDPSPENVREIVGWDGVEVNGCGKNIAHIVGYSATTPASSDPSLRKTSNNYGTTISTTDFSLPDTKIIVTQSSYTTDYDPISYRNGYFAVIVDNLDFTKRYKVSFNVDVISNPLNVDISRIRVLSPAGAGFEPPAKIDGNRLFFKNVPFTPHSKFPNRKCFEIRNASMSFILSEFMVTPIDEDDFEYEPYQGTIGTTNWSSTVGTVYGGYVDLISGELVEEYNFINIDYSNPWGTTTNYLYRNDNLPPSIGGRNMYVKTLCSHRINPYDVTAAIAVSAQGQISVGRKFCEMAGIEMTSDAFNQYLVEQNNNGTSLEVCYLLKTPIIHQLTPTQLSSFIGQNNFWSNADYVEIEYDLIETEDIQKCRKKIILNQPHIETVKNDLVNFTTDMKAPLKECKVYFEPIQEGEGDPSPDNVRNIIGWDEVNIYNDPKYGGNIVWNQLYNGSGSTGTNGGITYTKLDNGTWEIKGTSDTTSGTAARRRQIQSPSWEANHVYWFSARAVGEGTQYLQMVLSVSGSIKATTTSYDGAFAKPTTKINQFSFRVLTKDITVDAMARPQIIDLTILFGEEMADYIYDLEVSKSGAGKEYFFNLFPKDWYEYNAGEVTTVSAVNDDPYTSIPINWTDEVGTVYGGYVDLAKGELVANMTMIEFDGSSDENWQVETLSSGLTNYYMYATSLVSKARGNQRTDGYICSNMCIPRGENETYVSGMFYFSNSGALNVYLGGKSNTSTVAEFKSWLAEHKLQIAYWLAEPIHYQLTPQQLLTFKGENNIWSNSNDQTEVKFWTH